MHFAHFLIIKKCLVIVCKYGRQDMMKRIKRIKMNRLILIIGIITIIITMGGCKKMAEGINGSGEQEMKDKGNAALEYMKEKYKEEFTPITYGISDYLSDTDVVECYPSWMDPKFEHVSIFIHNDEGGRFGDNYFEFLKREELEESVKEILEPDFGSEIKVYQSCSNTEMPAELNVNSSIEDLYSSMKEYCIWADVFISGDKNITDEEFAQKMGSVKERFCRTGKSFVIHLYVVDKLAFEAVSREDRAAVMDAYHQNWKPDGVVVKNAEDMMISMGELN